MTSVPRPDVAVVIATYRRPDLLGRCLDALLAQTIDASRYEIVVADDDAGGPTAGAIRSLVDALASRPGAPSLRYVPVAATQGPAAARNAGWRASGAPVIAFTDDDTIPDARWLEAGLAALADGLDAAGGAIRMPLSPRPTDYERDAAGLSRAEFATANCFVARDALASVGGFDERFGSAWREDSDLHFSLMRGGWRVGFAHDAVVVHPVRPARFGVSVSQQKKVVYDALLYKKHRRLYRTRILRSPPWSYYASVGSLLIAVAAALAGLRQLALIAFVAWLALTLRFAAMRLRGTSRRWSHVVEMLWTSIAIPPLAIAWRLVGAIRYRVAFL